MFIVVSQSIFISAQKLIIIALTHRDIGKKIECCIVDGWEAPTSTCACHGMHANSYDQHIVFSIYTVSDLINIWSKPLLYKWQPSCFSFQRVWIECHNTWSRTCFIIYLIKSKAKQHKRINIFIEIYCSLTFSWSQIIWVSNILVWSISYKGYCRKVQCAVTLIFMFLFCLHCSDIVIFYHRS